MYIHTYTHTLDRPRICFYYYCWLVNLVNVVKCGDTAGDLAVGHAF